LNKHIGSQELLSGNRRALAKAITLIESQLDSHKTLAQDLLESVLKKTGKGIRIGITGAPGVGKSTFIEAFGLMLIELGFKVAVLAVDPSSPKTGGSILGDKTRMEYLSRHHNAFIRPSPSGESLGGVAYKTRETMYLCEAAGFDITLVETVGVGQSEYQVASMVDFFMVLLNPNTGDELQGIKKGIIEMADLLVINKADNQLLSAALNTQQFYKNALNLLYAGQPNIPSVIACSALTKNNLDLVWNQIDGEIAESKNSGYFLEKRTHQNIKWMEQLTTQLFHAKLTKHQEIKKQKERLENAINEGEITVLKAANQFVELSLASLNTP
tara:strand:- start:11434 stop:12417 length:984 start_codon:yes stop_codon:yes gene_type:complete